MQPYEEESKEDMRNKLLEMLEEIKQDITHMRQECKQEIMQEFATQRQEISSIRHETQASIRNLEVQITQVDIWMNEWRTLVRKRDINCPIEDVEDAFVEPFTDEIGVKKHNVFRDEPSVGFCDVDCRDACVENVIVYMIGEVVDDEVLLFLFVVCFLSFPLHPFPLWMLLRVFSCLRASKD
nr:uncharacterized protein LOC109169483 [Ipomoea batatas]